jgi:hypothetical protein
MRVDRVLRQCTFGRYWHEAAFGNAPGSVANEGIRDIGLRPGLALRLQRSSVPAALNKDMLENALGQRN